MNSKMKQQMPFNTQMKPSRLRQHPAFSMQHSHPAFGGILQQKEMNLILNVAGPTNAANNGFQESRSLGNDACPPGLRESRYGAPMLPPYLPTRAAWYRVPGRIWES